ncbi:hypothetical protein ACLBKU_14955 [Erythrobacter sp. NE805]|uniref:hypothetical protein n=1 Tax=Erythrobacter sp. NE805 TaxID=3389875 RepID=UPI00396B102A
MASQPGPSPYGTPSRGASARGVVLAVCLAFLAGGALVGWLMWSDLLPGAAASRTVAGAAAAPSPALAPSPTPQAAAAAVAATGQAVAKVAEQQGGLDQRLAAAEQRLTRLDLQAQAAAGNAARAESLLIAFATRRSIERGGELGPLADQLRLRFGDGWPNAVGTIIDFARNPVRLDALVARLDGLGPQLRQSDEGPSWGAFKRELKQLFVVRRETTPSPQPQQRLERARWALEQGRYEAAIAEVRGMPGAAKAQSWIADAERYRKAMDALEVIETAAVLDQRGLRDGAGNPVQQLSPLVRP